MTRLIKNSDGSYTQEVSRRGYDVIRDPLLNKGTGFSMLERTEFGLEGLLPPELHDLASQRDRVYRRLQKLPDNLKRYEMVAALQDRNEILFFSLLCEHLEELMPVIYTPTVGQATKKYSRVYRRARGVWITPEHKGRIRQILRNASLRREVRLIVVTDNESILGIGDQGAGGMAISIGKLSLYCAAAGIHPSQTLPVSLDVGTENAYLLDDPLYLGWRHRRLRGEAYDALIAEFVEAVKEEFSGVLVQWEDFRKDNALRILDRYRCRLPSFNDDIQGTGAVALAGIKTAMRITGGNLADQRVVILGAGAAGLGISRQIKTGMSLAGLSGDDLQAAVGVLDSRGLLLENGSLSAPYKHEMAWSLEIAGRFGLDDAAQNNLLTIIERYQPTVLIGSSGQSGAFSKEAVTAMAATCERPVILPFSNPNDLSEARPTDLYKWTDGKALVATGSPFNDVVFNDKTWKVGQGNNAFIFPGLGLGALLSNATQITDEMISAAAEALAQSVTTDEIEQGLLYPHIKRLRYAAHRVAVAVIAKAVEQGVGDLPDGDLEVIVKKAMWEPVYPHYVAV